MDQTILELRAKLTAVRDKGLHYLSRVERCLKSEFSSELAKIEHLRNIGFATSSDLRELWNKLPREITEEGLLLRVEVLNTMSSVATVAQRAVLVDKADMIALGKNSKRMAAAMRLRKFSSWDTQVFEGEDGAVATKRAGQSERESDVFDCREEFLDSVEQTFELIQLFGSRKEESHEHFGVLTGTHRTYRPATAFVMMRINPEQPDLKDVRDTVVDVFKTFGIAAVRADDLEHSEGITDRIVKEIVESEYLFADLTYERPSVYYEIGYAHAVGKAPMLFRRKGTYVHFDVAYRNCPEYENLSQLRELLTKRLTAVTGRNPD